MNHFLLFAEALKKESETKNMSKLSYETDYLTDEHAVKMESKVKRISAALSR